MLPNEGALRRHAKELIDSIGKDKNLSDNDEILLMAEVLKLKRQLIFDLDENQKEAILNNVRLKSDFALLCQRQQVRDQVLHTNYVLSIVKCTLPLWKQYACKIQRDC